MRWTVPVVLTIVIAACGGDASSPANSITPSPVTPSTVAPGPSTSACAAEVTGNPVSVPGSGGRYTLTVVAGTGCTWSALSDVAWATVAPSTGQGSGSTVLTVGQNPEIANTRSGNLTIAGQVLHFSQANGCSYTLDRTAADASAGDSAVSFALTTREGCSWTATGSESWLRPQPASGAGSATVVIQVSANTGGTRHAFATIAGQRVQITQEGH